MAITIKIFETSQTRIHPSMWSQPATRWVWLRRLIAFLDFRWTGWIPIYAFLIEHPEGNILFDTGTAASCTRRDYFPWWAPTRYMARFRMRGGAGQEVAAQLREAGVDPTALRAVVISHLHYDHSGGIRGLGDSLVCVTREHWESLEANWFRAVFTGAHLRDWPRSFTPRFLEPSGPRVGPFERSYPITADGRVVAVDTPGHAEGHVSLIVYGDDGTVYMMTGDAAFDLAMLDREGTDGINDQPLVAVRSARRIKQFCREQPTVLLPSHDSDSPRRLEDRVVYRPSPLKVRWTPW